APAGRAAGRRLGDARRRLPSAGGGRVSATAYPAAVPAAPAIDETSIATLRWYHRHGRAAWYAGDTDADGRAGRRGVGGAEPAGRGHRADPRRGARPVVRAGEPARDPGRTPRLGRRRALRLGAARPYLGVADLPARGAAGPGRRGVRHDAVLAEAGARGARG